MRMGSSVWPRLQQLVQSSCLQLPSYSRRGPQPKVYSLPTFAEADLAACLTAVSKTCAAKLILSTISSHPHIFHAEHLMMQIQKNANMTSLRIQQPLHLKVAVFFNGLNLCPLADSSTPYVRYGSACTYQSNW